MRDEECGDATEEYSTRDACLGIFAGLGITVLAVVAIVWGVWG